MLPKEREQLVALWLSSEPSFERAVERQATKLLSPSHAIFLYGPRRAGKSTIAKRLLSRLSKASKRVYVNFEDPVFSGREDYRVLDEFSEGLGKKDVIVLDEVSQVSRWERWVRSIADDKRFSVIVTGSNSKLLCGDYASTIGGRGIGFEVFPLSYAEFRRVCRRDFAAYLREGGYPEVVLEPHRARFLLASYFDQALLEDIVSRYGLKNATELREFAVHLISNCGNKTSLKRLRSSLHFHFDKSRKYLELLETSYLLFQVPFFSFSTKISLSEPRKIYAWDMGMQSLVSRSFTPDMGRKAENAVAIELKRRKNDLYYWQGRREVDFVAVDGPLVEPYNVCYSKACPRREVEGLLEFCQEKKRKHATMLYLGKSVPKQEGNIRIDFANLEDWFLGRVSSSSDERTGWRY